MKIGLIGAQNSHSRDFCETINKKKMFENAVISYIYGGDDDAARKKLCEDYGLAECASEEEVIEKSDAVIVTYRKGSVHYSPVINTLKAGKPVFNDKPFTTDLQEAREIIALAKKQNLLITGGSSLKSLPELDAIKESITPGSTTVISYAADPASEYDGYWFYGIHVAEICLTLCGTDFTSVQSFDNNGVVTAIIGYPDKTCILVTAPDSRELTVSVSNAGGIKSRIVPIRYHDICSEEFITMINTGELPRDYDYYVKSVELMSKICEMQALNKAAK